MFPSLSPATKRRQLFSSLSLTCCFAFLFARSKAKGGKSKDATYLLIWLLCFSFCRLLCLCSCFVFALFLCVFGGGGRECTNFGRESPAVRDVVFAVILVCFGCFGGVSKVTPKMVPSCWCKFGPKMGLKSDKKLRPDYSAEEYSSAL